MTVQETQRELDYGYIRQGSSEVMNWAFLRVVRPNTTMPADTISCEAMLDVDAEGNVIGVFVSWPSGTSPC